VFGRSARVSSDGLRLIVHVGEDVKRGAA